MNYGIISHFNKRQGEDEYIKLKEFAQLSKLDRKLPVPNNYLRGIVNSYITYFHLSIKQVFLTQLFCLMALNIFTIMSFEFYIDNTYERNDNALKYLTNM